MRKNQIPTINTSIKRFLLCAGLCLPILLSGCVDQHAGNAAQAESTQARLIATSRAAVAIAEKLDLELVGVPTLEGLPERYDDATRVGSAMGPDLETIVSLSPTEVFGPDTLGDNLRDGYENAGVPSTFLNLRSVEGLYDSVSYLGEKYDREEIAAQLVSEYETTMQAFNEKIEGEESPKVLALMGLPGAYVECTQNSYVGNLVSLAGGENVVVDDTEDFVSWNTEDLLLLDPDIIVLTAHALPEQVEDMFREEFATNDIWNHFRAVQEGRVYYLDYTVFGMSATFRWEEGLDDLYTLFYEGEQHADS